MLNTIDPSTPPNPTPAGLGGGEIRALKLALLTQFPAVSGDAWDIPLTVGPRSLNAVGDKVDQDDFDDVEARMSVAELGLVNQAVAITALGSRVTALETLTGTLTTLADATAAAIAAAWPVGSVFISYDGATPNSKGLVGTWVAFGTGSVLMGAGGTFGAAGGSMSLTIAEANLPAHSHHIANNDTVNPAVTPLLSSNQLAITSNTGGSFSSILGGSASAADKGKTSSIGSGTAADITPAHIKVAFYRRTV